MKKRFVGAFAVVLVAALALVGCGGGTDASASVTGRYNGYATTIGEVIRPIEETYDEGDNYVELQDDGAAVLCLDGSSLNGTYALDGENITITISGGEGSDESYDSVGTLKDGVLSFDFLGIGIDMTFIKDGVAAPFEFTDAATTTTDTSANDTSSSESDESADASSTTNESANAEDAASE